MGNHTYNIQGPHWERWENDLLVEVLLIDSATCLSFLKSPSFLNFTPCQAIALIHPLRTPYEGPASYIPLTTLHLFLPLESTLLSLVIPCPSPPQGTVPENLQAHVAMRQAIYSMYVVLSTADRIEYKYARKQPQGQG